MISTMALLAGLWILLFDGNQKSVFRALVNCLSYQLTAAGFLIAYHLSNQNSLTDSSNITCATATFIVSSVIKHFCVGDYHAYQ
jgi:hypothetical protein